MNSQNIANLKHEARQAYLPAFLLICFTIPHKTLFSKTAEKEKVGRTPVYDMQLQTLDPRPHAMASQLVVKPVVSPFAACK